MNYFEKQLDKDFYVISLPVWTGLLKLYGGGPAVEIEVGFDPKVCEFVPLVQLHSFKIHFGEKVEKVLISKFKTVQCLL